MRDGHRRADVASRHRWRHGRTGVLVWIAASKYIDYLPVYRIEQIAAREGVPLARSTPGAAAAPDIGIEATDAKAESRD